jgi:hypothetical protein
LLAIVAGVNVCHKTPPSVEISTLTAIIFELFQVIRGKDSFVHYSSPFGESNEIVRSVDCGYTLIKLKYRKIKMYLNLYGKPKFICPP